jgi:hypothetical protein
MIVIRRHRGVCDSCYELVSSSMYTHARIYIIRLLYLLTETIIVNVRLHDYTSIPRTSDKNENKQIVVAYHIKLEQVRTYIRTYKTGFSNRSVRTYIHTYIHTFIHTYKTGLPSSSECASPATRQQTKIVVSDTMDVTIVAHIISPASPASKQVSNVLATQDNVAYC